MPRKGAVPKRELVPDEIFGSVLVHRFINNLMKGGKKSVAEAIVYGALQEIQNRHSRNPLEVLQQAIRNTMPQVEVKSRRVGGANYQVPVEVRADRQVALSLRWLVQYSRARPERTMLERVANELWDASQRRGEAVRKRDDVHRQAEANKAYAHYRW